MSMGYAEKLSYKKEVGAVGMSEIFDPPEVLQRKIQRLAVMIVRSSHLVALTGAGISTSCGIPDFRGPKGVWTLQSEGKDVPEASVPFDRAVPSMTHMALVALEKAGILKFVISQNVDSLHLRSGIPREKLSELHGNSFREDCPSCGAEYLRDFEVETIGMKATPRRCSDASCGAKLKDTVLDWQDILPQKEMSQAEKHCEKADLVLCLGTSLQITPACDLPFQSLRRGGRIVIVNLQETPKDKKAALVIHGLVDEVIAGVMDHLNLKVPPFVRVDLFQIRVTHCPRFSEQKYVKWTLSITSVHGPRAPFPFVRSVEVSFPERPDLRSAALDKQPFKLKRETLRTNPLVISLKLHFGDGCKCQWTSVKFLVDFEVQPTIDLSGPRDTDFKEQVAEAVHYDKDAVIENLRNLAIEDQCCGQTSLIQRNKCPKQETFVYATTTNIVEYCSHAASATSSEHILKKNDYALKRDGKKSSTSSCAKKLKAK